MARENESSVRIGSITIFALVIVLCIAVMGMLAVSTGRAALASSEKQAMYTSEIYQNEKDAWEFVTKVDKVLYDLRNTWWWSKAQGIIDATEVVDETEGASIDNDEISATFTSENGKTLSIKMTITNDLQLTIDEWKVSTSKEMDNGDVLWSGM